MSERPAPPRHPLLDTLRAERPRQLQERLQAGHPVPLDAVTDTLFRGVSLGLPGWVESLTWTTFCKTVHRDPKTGRARGWNVRLEQTGLDGPVRFQQKRGAAFTFGHYAVEQADDGGLMLDYGQGGNGLDPTALVRDPVVALVEGSTELLLGWSYVSLFGLKVGTPSYFALQPVGPLEHVARP